jgi:methyl-accepting chemotaxis protein
MAATYLRIAVISIIGMIVGIVVFLFSTFYVAPRMTRPIVRLKETMNSLSKGNYNLSVEVISTDEFGELEQAFKTFTENVKSQVAALVRVSEGDLSAEIARSSDQDMLGNSLKQVVTTLQDLMNETGQLTKAAVAGKLSTRGEASRFRGGYRSIVEGINTTLDAVIHPEEAALRVLAAMAGGNLVARMEGEYQGDHQRLKDSINQVGQNLDQALTEVAEAINATASASSQISSSTEEMASGAQEQLTQSTEVVAAVEEMSKTIIDNAKNASLTAEVAKKARLTAEAGGEVVRETVSGMRAIAAVVGKSVETVRQLGKSSDQIGEIVIVIDDIADQTNLLALNAAIEAARAGEQGRGFAVVADEVRKLAERTTKATKEIAQMIKQIQHDTQGAVQSMEEGTRKVDSGIELADKAGLSLEEIVKVSQQVTDMVMQIAAASEQQSSASEEITKNVEGISTVTNQTASGTQQIARAAEDLNRLTDALQQMVTRFTLGGAESRVYNPGQIHEQRGADIAVRATGKLVKKT